MKRKINIKVIILVHLVGILILGVLFSFIGPANGMMLKWVMVTLFVSFVIQLLLYTFKPSGLQLKQITIRNSK